MRSPTPWRLVTLAFAAWAAVFVIGYAAALLDPAGLVAKAIIAATAVATIPLFVWIARQAKGRREAVMINTAIGIAAMSTAFQALVVIA
ncbi:hypothetical protein H8M03_07390 [Sphingomonas sabuli]|uniref:Uncharacterized protein n=1 Tax=Sphingomonas sabuli TaxID=2764186 RepID=A0A7G9KZS5_9SPHN|nr:hypothetical protein [Sphingomonas sabuli]QNM81874.1 hypothetical protein H8M03_07390 [Sphingomonas sabuli]